MTTLVSPLTSKPRRSSFRRPLWSATAAIVLLAQAFADEPGIEESAENATPPEQQLQLEGSNLYRWIFGDSADAVIARKQLDWILRQKIAMVDQVCRLTSAQKQKLHLAGRGDIRSFFDRLEELTTQFQLVKFDPDKVNILTQEAQSLNRHLTPRLFGDSSKFAKVLKTLLTAEQFAKYQPFEGLFGACGEIHLQRGTDEQLEIILGGIGDEELKYLGGLPRLQELRISSSQVTDAGLVHLTGLSSLRGLVLDGTSVRDEGLAHLKRLTSLLQLSLMNTPVTDAGLTHLNKMTTLQGLGLGGTHVTDAGLVQLTGLTDLRVLVLNNTRVTDAGMSHLKALTRLDYLSLAKTRVTDRGIAELKQSLPGLTIYK
jgi:hypothetical protein